MFFYRKRAATLVTDKKLTRAKAERVKIWKQRPRIFIQGLCLELLAGLVRSRLAATEQRSMPRQVKGKTESDTPIASHYFGGTGSSRSKAPELLFGGLHGATGRT